MSPTLQVRKCTVPDSDLSNTDLDADAMAAQYNDVSTRILDGLVPVTKTTCRVRCLTRGTTMTAAPPKMLPGS